jgi:DNA-binding beta-propeller fold protein YncE
MRTIPHRRLSPVVVTLGLLTAAASAGAFPLPPLHVETVATFDAAHLETPESMVFDRFGNKFVSLALAGEIRKIAPNGTQTIFARLPIGPPLTICGPFFNGVIGLDIDLQGTVYASVAACDPANRGVWAISKTGSARILATLPLTGLPNGIVLRLGQLYVADTFGGVIWRVPAAGGTAQVWLDDPLLKPRPGGGGPNGINVFRGELYVSNTDQGTIVAVPFGRHGAAGTPRVHATLPAGMGCDDFAFDILGRIYCATGPSNDLVRLDLDGSKEILLTAADGLDGPTDMVFGHEGLDRFNLYITNGAFPFASTTLRPSILKVALPLPGALLD